MKIINASKNTTIAQNGASADTFLSRLKGLIGKSALKPGEALVITRCQSIHMLFMQFAIDAVFVGPDGHVVGCIKNIKPFRFSPVFRKSYFVIELPAGAIDASRTDLGDVVKISD